MNPELSALKLEVEQLKLLVEQIIKVDKLQLKRRVGVAADGSIIGLAITDKLGFFNTTPQPQFSSAIGRSDFTTDTGLTAHMNTQYKGNTGTLGYSVGDLVAALKGWGFLAS